jgi:YkoY family integral membrane protein
MVSVATVFLICFLEGLLSLDNALVLAVMVKPLEPKLRKRALVYGIVGAFLFRAVSLFFITEIIASPWIKTLGGAYLIYLSGKFFFTKPSETENKEKSFSFWRTVLAVELMDIAFSVDSILAAVGISQDYKVVLCGGILGIIMMRFASGIFSKLLDKYPALEFSAHLLIALIGAKLILQTTGADFHDVCSPFTWAFGLSFVVSICVGFVQPSERTR